jgi:axial budding pattern protein 2
LSSSNNEPTATSGTQIQSKSTTGTNKALAIGLGVGIPLFFIIVAVILLLCCLKRRKNKKSNDKEATSSPKISKPILGNPANGQHNIISPNAFDDSSVETSFENEKLGGENEPKRLGALNVLKLDEKDYYSNDEQSSSSTNVASLGHTVDDSKSSIYQDALQSQSTDLLMKDYGHGNYDFDNYNQQMQQEANQPKKSWRQTIDSKINRESLNSLATVSTNELLSIRLAEDGDIAKDPRKSSLNFRDSAFIGNSTSSILTRDDSGNIQRLDSDGNIVETLKDTRQRASRATNLDILAEEFSPIIHDIAHENSFTSNSSGGEEFYPVSNQNGEIIKWEQQRKVDGEISKEHFMNHENNSKAKLKNFTNKGKADTSNDITQSTYETAEIESI